MTSSLLVPSYSLALGSQGWTEQLLDLNVRLGAVPALDRLVARLPAVAPLDAAIGDEVTLSLDGGEGSSDVFTGTVDSIRRDPRRTTVTALDAGGTLAAARLAATFEQVTVASAIRSLCESAEVEVGDLEDGPSLTFYAADPGRSVLDHVGRLAGWAGALAAVAADGKLTSSVVAGADPDLALRYGRELLAIEAVESAAPVTSFVVVGESGAGTASAPESLRPTGDFFAGSRPDGPSKTAVWRFEPTLRTPAAARTASAALDRLYASSRRRATMRATLLPALRPGAVLRIEDLPEGIPGGPYWLDRVDHRLSAGGATTTARLWQGGDAFDPSGLLGSLAGAVGGLP